MSDGSEPLGKANTTGWSNVGGRTLCGPVWLRGSHLLISLSNRFFNTPIMVNLSADHDKQPARPYKCPYPLCGRAFSRLEHQVPLSSFSLFHLPYHHPLDQAHKNSYRWKTLHLHLSFLREALFPLRRTHSSLSNTQQWSPSESPTSNFIFQKTCKN